MKKAALERLVEQLQRDNDRLQASLQLAYERAEQAKGEWEAVRSRRPTSVPSLQYESSPGEEVVGGFFFDIGAVRTDLTEMLRAGRTFGSGARRRQTVVGARAEQAQGVERATRVDRDARFCQCYLISAASETVPREVASQTKG